MQKRLQEKEAQLEAQMNAKLEAKEEEERRKIQQEAGELKKKEEQLRLQEEEAQLRRKKEEEERKRREEEELLRKQREEDLRRSLEPESKEIVTKHVIENTVAFSMEAGGINRAGWRKVLITIFQGRDLVACNFSNGQSDPFVVGKHYTVDGILKVKYKTKIVPMNRHNPYWKEIMQFDDFAEDDYVSLVVWDDGKTGFDFMGEIRLGRNDITHAHRGWFPLRDLPKKEKPFHPGHEAKKKEKKKEQHTEEEHNEDEKKGVFSKLTTGIKHAKENLTKKESLHSDSILDQVSKSRNVLKSKIRGTKQVTGDLELNFETLF